MVLDRHPDWRKTEAPLLKHMEKFSFPDAWGAIVDGRDQIFPSTAKSDMADRVEKYLARKFSQPTKQQAA